MLHSHHRSGHIAGVRVRINNIARGIGNSKIEFAVLHHCAGTGIVETGEKSGGFVGFERITCDSGEIDADFVYAFSHEANIKKRFCIFEVSFRDEVIDRIFCIGNRIGKFFCFSCFQRDHVGSCIDLVFCFETVPIEERKVKRNGL